MPLEDTEVQFMLLKDTKVKVILSDFPSSRTDQQRPQFVLRAEKTGRVLANHIIDGKLVILDDSAMRVSWIGKDSVDSIAHHCLYVYSAMFENSDEYARFTQGIEQEQVSSGTFVGSDASEDPTGLTIVDTDLSRHMKAAKKVGTVCAFCQQKPFGKEILVMKVLHIPW